MICFFSYRKAALAITIGGIVLLVSGSAAALDAAKDRRGLFWGMGFGGGGAVGVPSREAGGEINFDLQLGAGVSQQVTLDFDIDILTIIFDGTRNVIINPGPEVNYFFGDTGFYIRGGLGAAMSIVRTGDENDFVIGFDAGAGFGWEFFANTNLAIGIAGEGDYIVRKGDDLAIFGFMFELKYY
jgi:hypothetical protein